MDSEKWDAIILGGGSAGLSGALMLARSRRRVLVIDEGAPRNRVADAMHGVLGRDGWSPLDLLATGRGEVERYGGVVRRASAAKAERGGAGFAVTLESGEVYTAGRVLVATGLRDELPELPGLAEQWGVGVAHCPYCHGWEVRDQRIAVLSSGPMSIHQAQLVRQLSDRVTYFPNGTSISGDERRALSARGIAVESRPVGAVVEEGGRLSGLRLRTGDLLPIDAVFVRPRAVPNDGHLLALGAGTADAFGDGRWVTVDATGRTTVPGLWAAGNVVNPGATVPVAAAAGSTAGAMINADLVEEEIRTALAAG
ncbi:NAD(P)/FAD-dependent oxidoreductase [Naasia sp. SYSU D00057]|uniref:NAD(P)/FAD-dependent oxidoreductase n=1 Tax=Naasia sp. SYSU D00057 TaxID=2817380 RepID=UPI001B3172C1|nr:NAD(P)/FAD-dependent oxidoreductase [Naasia sp. SYSU D00057]